MFSSNNVGLYQRWSSLAGSIAIHCLFLTALLWMHRPRFLIPYAVQHGNYGTAVTPIYWTSGGKSGRDAGAAKVAHRAVAKRHIIFATPKRQSADRDDVLAKAEEKGAEAQANTPGQPQAAGSPYGSVLNGPLTGYEVRPALPVQSIDPIVTSSDLSGREGDVVVEITIDEKGNIVEKSVIRSLAPAIDLKVLAALESWHFYPATRDGVPISSKQDVHYHFPQQR